MTEDEEYEAAELRMTAIHEAGHFVMGHFVKAGYPRRISIARDEHAAGFCGGAFAANDAAWAIRAAMHAMAGPHACWVVGRDYDWLGGQDDEQNACELMRRWLPDEPHPMAVIDALVLRVYGYKRVRAALLEVADWLILKITPNQDEIGDMSAAIYKRLGFLSSRVDRWIDCYLSEIGATSEHARGAVPAHTESECGANSLTGGIDKVCYNSDRK